jgi:hypothetical protein
MRSVSTLFYPALPGTILLPFFWNLLRPWSIDTTLRPWSASLVIFAPPLELVYGVMTAVFTALGALLLLSLLRPWSHDSCFQGSLPSPLEQRIVRVSLD